jgi:hypothetical protein
MCQALNLDVVGGFLSCNMHRLSVMTQGQLARELMPATEAARSAMEKVKPVMRDLLMGLVHRSLTSMVRAPNEQLRSIWLRSVARVLAVSGWRMHATYMSRDAMKQHGHRKVELYEVDDGSGGGGGETSSAVVTGPPSSPPPPQSKVSGTRRSLHVVNGEEEEEDGPRPQWKRARPPSPHPSMLKMRQRKMTEWCGGGVVRRVRQRGSEEEEDEEEDEEEEEEMCRVCKKAARSANRRGCCGACYHRLYTRWRYEKAAVAIEKICEEVEEVKVSELVRRCEEKGVRRSEEELVEVARSESTKRVVGRDGVEMERMKAAKWKRERMTEEEREVFKE